MVENEKTEVKFQIQRPFYHEFLGIRFDANKWAPKVSAGPMIMPTKNQFNQTLFSLFSVSNF